MGSRVHLVVALAAALAVTGAPASAQTLIDGSSVDEIANIARGYGSVSLGTASSGAPRISGKIDGISYHLFLRNCSESHTDCEDLNFYAGFLDNKQPLDAINAWNRDKRFGRAYLDADLDAVIEFDVNVEYGISRENLDSSFAVWSLILKQYADHIGFER
jgi:hypothetical protein